MLTLPQLLIAILMAAITPVADPPAPAAPATTSPAAATPVANTPPSKLEFPLAGFRINVLETAKDSGSFSFTFPVSGDGTASVGVGREPTMKQRPSLQIFQDAKTLRAHNGDTILIEQAPASGEWRMEYTSTKPIMGNQPVPKRHMYEQVCSANGITYVISASALETDWPVFGPKLKAYADSFELSSAPDPGKVAFPSQGFRINKPDLAVPVDGKQPLLSMGFVSVQVEPYTKTLKDYQAEFKTRVTIPNGEVKILTENAPVESTLVTEYVEVEEFPGSGSPPNALPAKGMPPKVFKTMVCEKVVLAHGQLYRATGMQIDTASSYAQKKACVDSLEAIPVPGSAPSK